MKKIICVLGVTAILLINGNSLFSAPHPEPGIECCILRTIVEEKQLNPSLDF